MNGSGIDTSALLTMLGLIAAVWALVPSTARLSFQLSLSRLDWAIIWGALFAIHVLYFEPVLRDRGLYWVIGPWRWGFDKGGAQYLLFLALAGFVYLRSRRTRLNRRNLPLFEKLATSLLHSRKFEELATLLDHHLEATMAFANADSISGRVATWLQPPLLPIVLDKGEDGQITIRSASQSRLALLGSWLRTRAARAIGPAQGPRQRARTVVRTLLSSRDFVAYLALARPYLCLNVAERAGMILEEFEDEFFEALLANESSVIYSELKNSQNLTGGAGHRLAIPEENRLLAFYLKDVTVAAKLGVYRSVGEAVLSRIDADDALLAKLNGPLFTYPEAGKYRCPVFAGISFFGIMILEGLHQRLPDHLWLHYFPHFSRKLVSRARDLRSDDQNHEFPTPLCYLLYELVASTRDWIDDGIPLTEGDALVDPDARDGMHILISFEAAQAMGRILEPILCSPQLTQGLKVELLTMTMRTLAELRHYPRLARLESALRESLITPYDTSINASYVKELRISFDEVDHILRAELQSFDLALTEAEDKARGL
ncbi:hypothetical protein [Macromonas nakdongensis]|uniref:hypothetical protein n=1 Tax=Macromonas nakdongensis TaxID=1843082 RepID=UPI0012FF1A16|nr:hypothetical protein [Macromonas nakdongensis]